MRWYLRPWKNYFYLAGRAQRKEFWTFTIVNSIIISVLIVVDGMIGAHGFIFFPFHFLILCPSITVSVRRLHDVGRSGLWLLIGIIPFGGIVLFIFYLLDSEEGSNAYGPSPKEVRAEVAPVAEGAWEVSGSSGPKGNDAAGI